MDLLKSKKEERQLEKLLYVKYRKKLNDKEFEGTLMYKENNK